MEEIKTVKVFDPQLCKCRDLSQEGAMTVKVINNDFFQCPRCGGLIVRRRVDLDKEQLIANQDKLIKVKEGK
jgi:hypothetical protein